VAPNIERYELDPPPNPQRKAWPQPYPAVPGYSIRDSKQSIHRHTGQHCAGYLAPELYHSELTLDLTMALDRTTCRCTTTPTARWCRA